MAQLSTTYSFTANDNVTNTKLNGIIGNAILNPGAISEQTALVGSPDVADKFLVYDDSASTIRKVDLSELLKSPGAIGSTTANTGAFTSLSSTSLNTGSISLNSVLLDLVGMVAPFPIPLVGGVYTPPTGWLRCDGSQVLIASYQNLYNRIGLMFNASPTAGNFQLPDLRGYFVRGLSYGGATIDSGRVMGSSQADAFQSHTHTYTRPDSSSTIYQAGSNRSGPTGPTSGVATSATGSTETRPYNVALLYCIKF